MLDRPPLTIATSRDQAAEKIIASGLAPMGTTVGRPRFRLRYQLAGMAAPLEPRGLLHVEDRDAFELAYRSRLDRAGAEAIGRLLARLAEEAAAEGVVLLCFEDLDVEGEWCHRGIFAEWWHEQTGEEVVEL